MNSLDNSNVIIGRDPVTNAITINVPTHFSASQTLSDVPQLLRVINAAVRYNIDADKRIMRLRAKNEELRKEVRAWRSEYGAPDWDPDDSSVEVDASDDISGPDQK